MEILSEPEKKGNKLQLKIFVDSSEIRLIDEALNKFIQEADSKRDDTVVAMSNLLEPVHQIRIKLNPS